MKVAHWTFFNGSGLTNVATDMAEADTAMGLQAVLCDTNNHETWEAGMDANIHVVHAHLPDKLSFDKKTKIIIVEHGSPEHIFEQSLQQGVAPSYAAADSFSLACFFLKRANAVVTFWPRHAAIWETLTGKPVYCIPMGVKLDFWQRQQGIAPLAGNPPLFTAENAHNCKWPLDLFLLWPHLIERFPDARLHAINIPTDQHRWWWPLAFLNGSRYTSYMTALRFDPLNLRNYLSAAPYYYSPVRYGDHNRICLEAAACGSKVVSFEGNEYAHYWVREGDQRRQLEDLTRILKGEVQEREPLAVPDIKDTAAAMLQIYHKILLA